jgi:predicted LPLAT superfamily acyltransferase/glycosyltransferase involved in cell wall biosynthesis
VTLRILLCIPTYNNPRTIRQVVSDALELTSLSVLVVDDGSAEPVPPQLAGEDALASGRLNVLRLGPNRGKGVALQTAIRWALEHGFTHLLSVDGDGQHLLSEADKLIQLAVQKPWSLVIGQRRWESSDDVPEVSKFGRRFSNFWVKYQTGRTVQDSQSGYRLYPLFHLQTLRFFTRRYDFEIESLVRLMWKQVEVQEVEIDVHYPPAGLRVSHFDKLWDNVRISLLNTVLVVISLLRDHLGPWKVIAALAAGMASAAFLPFAALPWLLCALTLAFRWNGLVMLLGMFLMPLLWPALGLLSIPVASVAVGGARFWQLRASAPRTWTGKTRGGKLGNSFLRRVLQLCGLRAGYVVLWFIVPYFYIFAPRGRRSLHEYWRVIEPSLSGVGRRWAVLKHFYRFGQVLMDRAVQAQSQRSVFAVNTNGVENILQPLGAKQPLILLSSHVGGWDVAASILSREKTAGRFHMVHYRSEDFTFEKVIGPAGVKSMLVTEDPVLRVKQMLEKGELVGLMGDRPSNSNFELVPFFGHLLAVDIRALRIAAACKSSLLFTFGFRGQVAYDFFALPAFAPQFRADGPERPVQIRAWAADYAKALETKLRDYREQWFNFYPAFSQPPEPPPGVLPGIERNHLWQEWHKPQNSAPGLGSAPTANGVAQSPRSNRAVEEYK